MTAFPFYRGVPGVKKPEAPVVVPRSRQSEQTRPDGYLADPGLVDAANVALLLAQPLLLTGEPGTGKTQFASSLAWELGLDPPLVFETKSTSTAADLFYAYDALGRFHAAQSGEGSRRALDYLTYHALGLAILRANPEDQVAALLPAGFRHGGQRQSVVLIDEIDKAPRDFPNDLLGEVERMFFRIPELGHAVVTADPQFHPILVLTSNSEKNLPDAFLRRCTYYHIPFPSKDRLAEIIAARLGRFTGQGEAFIDDALGLFGRLRAPTTGLRKRPATAELIGWLEAMRSLAPGVANPLANGAELGERTLSVLVKAAEDREEALAVLRDWRGDGRP